MLTFTNVITVLADQHHYLLKHYLHPSIHLERYDPIAGWTKEQIHKADAILVRTTNPLNRTSLPENCNIRFAGTASAGRDHLDESFLKKRGIHIADAKGSNARSVAEYVSVAVLSYCDAHAIDPESLTVGVVGAGFTGSATAELLQKIGVTCRLFDPPKQEREPDIFQSVTLEEVLSCDIITFHVPLEQAGRHPTWHWYNHEKIQACTKKLVINASRGGVVEEKALLMACHAGHIEDYICDVWEKEPLFSDTTAHHAFLATPHIAGYSIEAKRKATEMMCDQLHRFFGIEHPDVASSDPRLARLPDKNLSLTDTIQLLHPAFSYDATLRKLMGLPDTEKAPAFLKLRQNTPLRNEFRAISIPASFAERFPVLRKIGFQTTGFKADE